jgi:hypothetical protein
MSHCALCLAAASLANVHRGDALSMRDVEAALVIGATIARDFDGRQICRTHRGRMHGIRQASPVYGALADDEVRTA